MQAPGQSRENSPRDSGDINYYLGRSGLISNNYFLADVNEKKKKWPEKAISNSKKTSGTCCKDQEAAKEDF